MTSKAYDVGVLWCPNPSGNRAPVTSMGGRTGWVFPRAVEKHLIADCAGSSVLHLFGGRSSFGTRQDIDPEVRPDVFADAWLPPFREGSFDIVILDPPYVRFNSQVKNSLLRAAAYVARRRVVWFSTQWISQCSGLSTEAAWLVRVGDNCHVRCLQYFRIRERLPPQKHFARGPAMKYNRWLRQPQGLTLFPEALAGDRPNPEPHDGEHGDRHSGVLG